RSYGDWSSDVCSSDLGEGGPWWGRLDEIDFLGSLYDLDRLASTDSRFSTAREDIIQHRINNPLDWPDQWVFEDPQFQLLDGPDEDRKSTRLNSSHRTI